MCRSVVAIVGQHARPELGASYQQEVALTMLFTDVREYVEIASMPEQVRHLIDCVVRVAQTRRGVNAVVLPNDLQDLAYEDPPLKHGTTHTGVGVPAESKVPEEGGLRAAAASVRNAAPCWSAPAPLRRTT